MTKLEIISEILSDDFKINDECKNQLIEKNSDAESKPFCMKMPIVSGHSIAYFLYKFDTEKKTIFPYFKKDHGLRKICDYVLFAEAENDMYIFLIELKKGTHNSSGKQLEASKIFVQYLIDSAKRVGYGELDKDIYIRTVRICDASNSKKSTKEKVIEYDVNGHVDYRYQQFRLKMLMDY
jgi:hypothetical protein